MKYTYCLLLAMMAGTSFAQTQKIDTIRVKDASGLEFFTVKKNTTTLAEGAYLKGVPEGTWINYWEINGYPQYITTYKSGKLNGVRMQMNQQGFTEMIEHYKDDLLDGAKRTYQAGTQYLTEEINYAAGKKNGTYIRRYPMGKLQEESNYKNGERDGKTTWYFESGEKTAEYHYKNGNIDGEVASYYKNGKVSEFGLYTAGAQTGVWKEFYESGALKAEGKYVNGQKDGTWKQYDESGKITKTVNYKNGTAK